MTEDMMLRRTGVRGDTIAAIAAEAAKQATDLIIERSKAVDDAMAQGLIIQLAATSVFTFIASKAIASGGMPAEVMVELIEGLGETLAGAA